MKRRPLSTTRKLKLWETCGGVCHICEQKIRVGERWDVEHIIPLAMGGADDESNMAPAHAACHAPKTVEDVGRIAKAKRQKARHIGIKKRAAFQKPPGVKYDWKLGRNVRTET
jgi:5-methylcytosine-specific restriction endonuclease McrA